MNNAFLKNKQNKNTISNTYKCDLLPVTVTTDIFISRDYIVFGNTRLYSNKFSASGGCLITVSFGNGGAVFILWTAIA